MSEENLAPAAGQAESGAVEQEMNNLMQQRMLKVRELREAGVEPFGRAFPGAQMIGDVRDTAAPAEGEEFGPVVTVAGRLMAKRGMGKSIFADLKDSSGKIQLFVGKSEIGDDAFAMFKKLDIGDIIGITGPVACGKSTLGRVFLCEAPYQGSVCFGGRELSTLTPRQIAATVGYLGHDPELSADTVQNNVLCGSEQDAVPWLAAVALKEEVLAMEKGTETVTGSGGPRLSGGQAQRLALARTLAHPRPVLILDDPFSALDRKTEDTVFANLQEYAKNKTVFLISHRLYHFPQMRQVIFMEDGKTAVGTHAELMASVPVYRQLYESQTGGTEHEDKAE